MLSPASRPLLIGSDPHIREAVLRIGEIAGLDFHVCLDAETARPRWLTAPLVLVEAEAAGNDWLLPRRADVLLIAQDHIASEQCWRLALAIGAEDVLMLPAGQAELLERLSATREGPSRHGRVTCVMPATGGAGASTLATSLSLHAVKRGERVLLVDADRLGGGLDVVLGGEYLPGPRWSELLETGDAPSGSALARLLPEHLGISVLSWGREPSADATAEVMSAVIDASCRSFDHVIVDLPRSLDAVTLAAVGRAQALALVVRARVRSALAGMRMAHELLERVPDLGIVVREQSRGVQPEIVGQITGAPVLGVMPQLANAPLYADRGEISVLPGALLDACLMRPAITLAS